MGAIDEKVFEQAFQNLVNNTDVLRSIFSEVDGIPYQSFQDAFKFELEIVNFTSNDNESLIKDWVSNRAKKCFDISQSVFDTALLRITADKYIWFFNMHHLITDGATTTGLYAEMSANYTAILNDSLIDVTNTFLSFEDYIHFERAEQKNTNNEVNRSFWKSKMKEIEELPKPYGINNNTKNTRADRLFIPLGNKRSEQIRKLSKHPELRSWTENSTVFNIITTVFLVLLSRVSGQKKLSIGVTTHNRTNKNFLETPGLFIEVFPLLNEVSNEDSLLYVYQKVKSEINVFFKNIKPGLHNNQMGRSSNVILNYNLTRFTDFNDFPTKSEWIFPGHIVSSNLMELHIIDFNNTGDFQLLFDLKSDVFPQENQQFVPQHFVTILDAFITNKNTKLNEFSLITEGELEKIESWNDTSIPFDATETLLYKFENQVTKTPDAIALIFGKETYSYSTLNEKANNVAHLLIKKGVTNSDIVAISLVRSFEMMVHIYGIIKAGAAYLPMDIMNPNERNKFIANDANVKILFYNHDNIKPDSLEGVKCLDVRKIKNQIVSKSISNPNIIVRPENLAYVIYTSGSTGKPKGVKCHHKGICNRLNWMNRDYPINENDTLIQKTPITFDVSLWELFWPLQVGAKLVIEEPTGHKDPYLLIETIKRNSVSVIHFVPSMLSVFVQSNFVGECNSLRSLFCSGEVLPTNTVAQAYEKLNQIDIYNLYGPTEASVDVTSWKCEKNVLNKDIPIGYPVANTKINIVDEKLNQVPIGVKGELCIGGAQVASGYLNNEQLTEEKFVDDIFSNAPNAKMYKTGDIARYRHDGAIEYLGRTDNQVKIRGIRIELGEIEKVIALNFDVSEVAVVVDLKENLICYYTGNEIIDHQVKNRLLHLLPEYMVPAHFEKLEEMPLTKNGKTDRSAFKKTETSPLISTTNFVAPKTEIEELVAKIWNEVLGIDRIGINDNFIALGGHSLAAIRVTSRINQEIEINFSLDKIFELPTISEYARYIEKTLLELLQG